jgi:hypothetical protein
MKGYTSLVIVFLMPLTFDPVTKIKGVDIGRLLSL